MQRKVLLARMFSGIIPGSGLLLNGAFGYALLYIALALAVNNGVFWILGFKLPFYNILRIWAGLFGLIWICSFIHTWISCKHKTDDIYEGFISVDINDVFRHPEQTVDTASPHTLKKRPWLAAFFSLVQPGFGHLYIEKWKAGWVYFGLSIIITGLGREYYIFSCLCTWFYFWAAASAYIDCKADKNVSRQKVKWFTAVLMIWAYVISPILLAGLFIQPSIAVSGSMEDTIITGDVMLFNRRAYKYAKPQAGDIVFFKMPPIHYGQQRNKILVKRIIAVGGQKVQILEDGVMVDGNKRSFYSNPEVIYDRKKQKPVYSRFAVSKPYTVPKNHYFVMGDNINDSMDSRCFWPIPESEVIGKLSEIIWPVRRAEKIK